MTAIGSSGKYIGFGLSIETGTEGTTIVDVFNIIQKVRDTVIHLEDLVDEEDWTIEGHKAKHGADWYRTHLICLSKYFNRMLQKYISKSSTKVVAYDLKHRTQERGAFKSKNNSWKV